MNLSNRIWMAAGFFRSVEKFPDRSAVEAGDTHITYGELSRQVCRLAQTLLSHSPSDDPPLTVVFAQRSIMAYAGILAALARGHGYVPLTPTTPPMRNGELLERVGSSSMIVDSVAATQLPEILGTLSKGMTIVMPETNDVESWARDFPLHRFVSAGEICDGLGFSPRMATPEAIAYLLFTSGSTGTPKGVMVSHANVHHFLSTVADWYSIGPDDRLTQLFELVFAPSIFDLFAAWNGGACLCCPTRSDLLLPGAYAVTRRPTIWFSVPSTAWLVDQQRGLAPGALSDLRLSLFCGEALPVALVKRWSLAAPQSRIENLYGPTELTLACTRYVWRGDELIEECRNGIVPIGEPFPQMQIAILDEHGTEVAPGEAGELYMSGPQTALGYFQSPELTEQSFHELRGRVGRFYKTGDRVLWPIDSSSLQYLGRVDHQIKIRGNRVELGEVESALRQASRGDSVVAIGWPRTPGGASGIVAFLEGTRDDPSEVLGSLKKHLPPHMIPADIQNVASFPLNTNGKIDRSRLIAAYERQGRRRPYRSELLSVDVMKEPITHAIDT